MSQSLAQIYLHIVFSTKVRIPFLKEKKVRDDLYAYMAGICKNLDSPAQMVGGVEDHVHLLCRHSKNLALSHFLQELKRDSSKWVKTQAASLADFHWQGGYGAFSVSPSHVDPLNTLPIRKSIISGKRSKMSFGGYAESMASRSMSDMFGIRKY